MVVISNDIVFVCDDYVLFLGLGLLGIFEGSLLQDVLQHFIVLSLAVIVLVITIIVLVGVVSCRMPERGGGPIGDRYLAFVDPR